MSLIAALSGPIPKAPGFAGDSYNATHPIVPVAQPSKVIVPLAKPLEVTDFAGDEKQWGADWGNGNLATLPERLPLNLATSRRRLQPFLYYNTMAALK